MTTRSTPQGIIPEVIIPDQFYSNGQLHTDTAIIHTGGVITELVPQSGWAHHQLLADHSRAQTPGILAPGFVDVHSHGAFGVGFGDDAADATATALHRLLRTGVTSVLPTMPSMSLPDITAAIDLISTLPTSPTEPLPHIPGVHLEGPYFSPHQRGAQQLEVLRTPDDGSIHTILERAEAIAMISFAPELPGAIELTKQLVAADIVAAAGHTDGNAADLRACQDAGLSHVIHIVSGQSTTTRQGPWRIPGMLEATLASDGLTVEMIADGKHLPPELMQIAYRCLGGRLCAVSDSTAGSGLPEGSPFRIGPGEYVVKDGVGFTLDGSAFGGSTTVLPHMLPIVLDALKLPLPQALAMFTDIPARAAKLTDVGQIAPGFQANFVLLDDAAQVTKVAHAGIWLD